MNEKQSHVLPIRLIASRKEKDFLVVLKEKLYFCDSVLLPLDDAIHFIYGNVLIYKSS